MNEVCTTYTLNFRDTLGESQSRSFRSGQDVSHVYLVNFIEITGAVAFASYLMLLLHVE